MQACIKCAAPLPEGAIYCPLCKKADGPAFKNATTGFAGGCHLTDIALFSSHNA